MNVVNKALKIRYCFLQLSKHYFSYSHNNTYCWSFAIEDMFKTATSFWLKKKTGQINATTNKQHDIINYHNGWNDLV